MWKIVHNVSHMWFSVGYLNSTWLKELLLPPHQCPNIYIHYHLKNCQILRNPEWTICPASTASQILMTLLLDAWHHFTLHYACVCAKIVIMSVRILWELSLKQIFYSWCVCGRLRELDFSGVLRQQNKISDVALQCFGLNGLGFSCCQVLRTKDCFRF